MIGYNTLTTAKIGKTEGHALGPLGIKHDFQNRGIGLWLVKESIKRAKMIGYSWIALVGGDYYSRFGFEKVQTFNIMVSDNDFDNAHIQILFLDNSARDATTGKLVYCDAFYDAHGTLL